MRGIGPVLAALILCAGVQAVMAEELYVYAGQWGAEGGLHGEFRYPTGVAADGAGYVYVVDGANWRVQKFTGATGAYSTSWGTSGGGPSQFSGAQDVAVSATGDVYVADTGNDRIQKFTSTGGFVRQWGSHGSVNGQFLSPYGVGVDTAGNVYVADEMNYRIQKFSPNGVHLAHWGYQGSVDGAFQLPSDVAVDAAGNVYVTDSMNHRVQKFSADGTFLAKWGRNGGDGTSGAGDGEFYLPRKIAVDAAGNVFVTDSSRVQKFSSSGAFLAKWGGVGTGNGQFQDTVGVAVDASGTVYVADNGNARVQRFRRGLVAGFTSSPNSGYEPLAVQFTDASNGEPTTWLWEFGDGTTSTVQNPLHVYQQDGSYTATLTVTSPGVAEPDSFTMWGPIVVRPLTDGLIRVEAEDYDPGGEGVAYHDTTHGNAGGVYRTDDVDIMAEKGGMYVVFNTVEGEWTRYAFPLPRDRTFTYPLSVRAHASGTGRTIGVLVNGRQETTLTVRPALGYTWANGSVTVPPGLATLTFVHHDSSIAGAELEFDYFCLDPDGGILPVPGGAGVPTSTAGDSTCDDVNGNGRADFADVVLYFNQMSWIAANEPLAPFDYNANGRIDFADVVRLFDWL